MEAGDKWGRLEEIVRRVLQEELELLAERLENSFAAAKKKPKVELVGGKWIGITAELREAWSAAYGAVDLDEELRRSAVWCASNPMKAPKTQVARFINAWLSKEQNRAAMRSIPTVRSIIEKRCRYCERPASGTVNGYDHCTGHAQDAMDNIKPLRVMSG